MVYVSKSAIQCPSASCDFAYFASGPDPAARLRNHFNNLKARDAEHDSFFKKPFCVFYGDVIVSTTRKGLWKSAMNKHWLITHSAEFIEAGEQHGKQEMEIALLLSPSQLERLSSEWQLEYELEEGDLIVRKGRATHLSRGIVIARSTSKDSFGPLLKRRRITYKQVQSGRASGSTEPIPQPMDKESDLTVTMKENSMALDLASDERHLRKINAVDPLENVEGGQNQSVDNYRKQGSTDVPTGPTNMLFPDIFQEPHLEPYSADAFTAITFCFPGFNNDIANIFKDCVQHAQ